MYIQISTHLQPTKNQFLMIRYNLWSRHIAHHHLGILLEFYLQHTKVLLFWLLYITYLQKKLGFFNFYLTLLHCMSTLVYPFLPFNNYWYLVQYSKQMKYTYELPKSQRIERIEVDKNERNQHATTWTIFHWIYRQKPQEKLKK